MCEFESRPWQTGTVHMQGNLCLMQARQPLFKTLSHIPSLGPAGQHALANTFSSLGALMAEFLDPNKCACWLLARICSAMWMCQWNLLSAASWFPFCSSLCED